MGAWVCCRVLLLLHSGKNPEHLPSGMAFEQTEKTPDSMEGGLPILGCRELLSI